MTMKQTKTLKFGLAVLVTVAGVGFSAATQHANAQEKKDVKVARSQGGRDPFTKYKPPQVIVKKAAAATLVPSIERRIDEYRAQKVAAMNAHVAAPKPTTAFLLNEIQVVGISRTPRGYAAIVEATPIKLAYVIYPGERFYDGQLVAIEDNRLIFRREIVFSDGRRERSVEMKPLRQPTAVNALSTAAVKPAAAQASEPEAEKKSEKPASEKP